MPQKFGKVVKQLGKLVLPYGIVSWWRRREQNTWTAVAENAIKRGFFVKPERSNIKPFSYDGCLDFIVSLGYERDSILRGTIPKNSLDFCSAILAKNYTDQAVNGLHVGNFVGISLAYIAHFAKSINLNSHVFSIDPNLAHRRVQNPTNVVVGLLNTFGLESSCSILTGYSLEYNEVNEIMEPNPINTFFDNGWSLTHQLEALVSIGQERFDFIMVDGSHEGAYVQREIEICYQLLKPGGLIFMDDVDEFWDGVLRTYETIDESRFEKAGYNGRIGVLRKHNDV